MNDKLTPPVYTDPPKKFPPALEPTLMKRGSLGAVRLAAAPLSCFLSRVGQTVR